METGLETRRFRHVALSAIGSTNTTGDTSATHVQESDGHHPCCGIDFRSKRKLNPSMCEAKVKSLREIMDR